MSLLNVLRRRFQHTPFRSLRSLPQRNLPISQSIGERRLDVVILGAPNAGKSVLLNNVIQSKVAAISRKRHTTRGEILGVSNHRNVQLAFYDTPGYVYGQDAQSHEMKVLRSLALDAAKKADVALLVVDAAIHHMHERQQDAFAEMVKIAFFNAKTEVILVLNKVDLGMAYCSFSFSLSLVCLLSLVCILSLTHSH
jgi:small GTP-binding protein